MHTGFPNASLALVMTQFSLSRATLILVCGKELLITGSVPVLQVRTMIEPFISNNQVHIRLQSPILIGALLASLEQPQ
jgi:hypothetical protein